MFVNFSSKTRFCALFAICMFFEFIAYTVYMGSNIFTGSSIINRHKIELPRPRRAVRQNLIILSPGRSGSTFLGELFNQNPDVFYVFEPLFWPGNILNHNVFYKKETSEYNQLATGIMQALLSCNFTNQEHWLKAFSGHHAFRLQSKVLSSAFFVKANGSNKNDRKNLLPFDDLNLASLCRRTKYTVLKILENRLPHKSMKWLQQFSNVLRGSDFKIIHLVRDPRAIIFSWIHYNWIKGGNDVNFSLNARRICNPTKLNIKCADSSPSWLRNRYRLVHFEELVQRPVETAEKLYRFVGFKESDEVRRWIASQNRKPEKKDLNSFHSTVRNASTVVSKWRSGLDNKTAETIGKACGWLIKRLGYEL